MRNDKRSLNVVMRVVGLGVAMAAGAVWGSQSEEPSHLTVTIWEESNAPESLQHLDRVRNGLFQTFGLVAERNAKTNSATEIEAVKTNTESGILAGIQQMIVSPTTTTAVRTLRITSYTATSGCSLAPISTLNLTNGNDVNMTGGVGYHSTNASNYALQVFSSGQIDPTHALLYQFLDSGGIAVGTSICIDQPGVCTDPSNCGWSTSVPPWIPF